MDYLLPGETLRVTVAGHVTLTGTYSGKTASVTVTAHEEIPPETYLKIAYHFAEITNAGEKAQAAARRNLRADYTVSVSPPREGR